MAYCIDPRGAAGEPGEVHATQLNTVGVTREFSNGWYIYLAGVANMVAGNFVCYKPGVYTTALLTTAMRGDVAIATAAVDATTKWGWFGYIGSFTATCLSATLSNVPIYATATAGSAEDVLTKNEQIEGAFATGAPVTSTGGGSQVVAVNRATVGNYSESV